MTRLIDVMAEISRRELSDEDGRIRRAAESFHADDVPRFADLRDGGNMPRDDEWRPSLAVWVLVAATWPMWAWAAAWIIRAVGS